MNNNINTENSDDDDDNCKNNEIVRMRLHVACRTLGTALDAAPCPQTMFPSLRPISPHSVWYYIISPAQS